MNKNKILLVIAITGLVIVSNLYVQLVPVNSLLTASAECTEDNKDEKIKIAEELFSNFVNEQKTQSGKSEECEDFIITNIYIVESDYNSFTAKITYDIKSRDDSDAWLAGNGIKKEDNWIRNKNNFVSIEKDDENYSIKNIFT